MPRHRIAAGLAGASALCLAVAHLTDLLPGAFPTVLSAVSSFLGVAVLVGLPVVGAVLVARRYGEGVAVLVALAFTAVPVVATVVYFLGLGGDDRRGLLVTAALLVGQVAVVAAGALAWTLRDPADWRWDRPLRAVYVVLAVAVLIPEAIILQQSHGWSFPASALLTGDLLSLAQLGTFVVAAGLLLLAARLPRRVASVILLVLLLPRLHQSVLPLVWTSTQPGLAMSLVDWLGLCAEVALTATALWWLGRERPLPTRNVPTTPASPSVG